MTLTPVPGPVALDSYFLEARSKLLDLAAIFDRIDRGQGAASDPRYDRLKQALVQLSDDTWPPEGRPGACRAEQLQRLFSLEYDGDWKRPTPR